MTQEFLTYSQTAEFLGVALGTVYSMVARKQIPHVRIGPRLVRFRRVEIEAWLQACTVEPGSSGRTDRAR